MFGTTMDIAILVFGMLSTIFTAVMNVPLAWKVFRTKSTTSLSIGTLFLTLIACLFWLVYATLMLFDGYLIDLINPLLASLPILISKIFMSLLMCYMIVIKLRNTKKDKLFKANASEKVAILE